MSEPHASPPSTSATLDELERKLRELERELGASREEPPPRPVEPPPPVVPPPLPPPRAQAAPPPPPPPRAQAAPPLAPVAGHPPPEPGLRPPAAGVPPPGPDDTSALFADARARMSALSGQVQELLRFRDELQRSAQGLISEHGQLLAEAQHGPPATELRAPPAPFRAGPETAVPTPLSPGTTGTGGRRTPPRLAFPEDLDHQLLQGAVTIEAGPFGALAELGRFQRELGSVGHVESIRIDAVTADSATFSLILAHPVALIAHLRAILSRPFEVEDSAAGRLTLHLGAAPASAGR